jgi:nucleotide-binding universal stress UspA family protein
MFRNILISVDGSPHAEEALRQAIDIAAAGNGRMTILTAIPNASVWAANPAAAAVVQSLSDDLEHEFTDVARRATAEIPESVPVTTIVTHEPIRTALMHQIETGRYDLLVMGSRGRGALSASVLGSVSHYALNHSPIPVLIVHEDTERRPSDPERSPGVSDRSATAPATPTAEPGRPATMPA